MGTSPGLVTTLTATWHCLSLRTTNGGVYQVATGVNDTFEHAYQNLNSAFLTSITRENGDQWLFGFRAVGATPSTVEMLPVLKRADGTVIQCNSADINITFTSVLNSILWHPLYVTAIGVANHGSIELLHSTVADLITGSLGTETSDSIMYGLGTFGSGSDVVDIAQDIEFSGTVTGLDVGQGAQGRYRVYLYQAVSHDATAPTTPSATFDGTDFGGVTPSTWKAAFPSSQVADPATYDVYQSFAVYDPANPNSALEFSTPFQVDVDAGPAGPAGARGATGARGPIGPQGTTGDTGPRGLQGPTGVQGERGPRGNDGARGEQGLQGPVGDTGPQGLRGATGPRGEEGLKRA